MTKMFSVDYRSEQHSISNSYRRFTNMLPQHKFMFLHRYRCLSLLCQANKNSLILNLHDSHLFKFFLCNIFVCKRKETIMYLYCIYTSILTVYTLLLNTESPASAVQMITLTVCSTTMGMSGVRHMELWWMDLLCVSVKEPIRNTC